MIVADIIKRVRDIAGDTDVLQFTDATLRDWINEGMRQCAIDNDLSQKTITQNTVVGTGSYSLPTDIVKIHSIKYDNEKLPILTKEEFDEQYTTDGTDRGRPVNGVIWAGNLELYPVPDGVKPLRIDYVAQPTEVADNNATPAIPTSYHGRLVDFCLAMVAQQDSDINLYQLKMDEFRSGVQSLKDEHNIATDEYPSISVSARDMGNFYEEGVYD
jgi:hypothetical protein